MAPDEQRENGKAVVTPPSLQLELTYAVTAWTKAVEDEHRLLSQVLAILFSYRRLPLELLDAALDGGTVLARAETSVGRPREEKADFWTSVGGQYKASIDFVVHTQIASGAAFVRGPEVRTQTVRTRMSDGPAAHDDRVPPDRGNRERCRRAAGGRTPGSRSPRRGCGRRRAGTGASASTGSSPGRTR